MPLPLSLSLPQNFIIKYQGRWQLPTVKYQLAQLIYDYNKRMRVIVTTFLICSFGCQYSTIFLTIFICKPENTYTSKLCVCMHLYLHSSRPSESYNFFFLAQMQSVLGKPVYRKIVSTKRYIKRKEKQHITYTNSRQGECAMRFLSFGSLRFSCILILHLW